VRTSPTVKTTPELTALLLTANLISGEQSVKQVSCSIVVVVVVVVVAQAIEYCEVYCMVVVVAAAAAAVVVVVVVGASKGTPAMQNASQKSSEGGQK